MTAPFAPTAMTGRAVGVIILQHAMPSMHEKATGHVNHSPPPDPAGPAMRAGVIYVARGVGYLDLARASAQSLRAVEPDLPVDLFTDSPEAAAAGLFDRVLPIPDSGTRDKIACMALSRFERTLFLDCDTLVLAPLGDLFAVLDRVDLAVCHDVRRDTELIRESWRKPLPYAVPQFNTGVMLYRRSPRVAGFLADWAAAYVAAGRSRDQVTFRELLWLSELRFHVLPVEFNLRRVTVLDAWEPGDARPTILHSHRLLQHLRGAQERLDCPTAILEAERAALAEEWRRRGLTPARKEGEDPLARFAAARLRRAP